jgi:ubiquinone biosynthesis protein UbiJ
LLFIAAIKFNMLLETLFQAGQAWHNETLATLKQNTLEFLQEETRDLPASAEVELFYAELADLTSDAQKLSDKIERLAASSNQ